jgi:hypothetical protein
MRYIEAPEPIDSLRLSATPKVFLAGGITGCEDWQRKAVNRLWEIPDLIVFNPRRASFDVTDPTTAETQITWEWQALKLADVIFFWFPACDAKITVQPIALFELGRWSGRPDPFVVGADEHYPRRFDIVQQLRLECPYRQVHRKFDDAMLELLQEITALQSR